MVAFVGRDVTLEFAIAKEDASVGSLSWQTLGMVRAKSPSVSWETADTTADKSPQFTKTNLVTFREVKFSGDGVSYSDAAHNQKALKAHVYNPPVGTDYQPKVWWRITDPDGSQTVGPFIVNSWNDERPYDGPATFSFESTSNGAVTYTPT